MESAGWVTELMEEKVSQDGKELEAGLYSSLILLQVANISQG